jgi:hypothetical protein
MESSIGTYRSRALKDDDFERILEDSDINMGLFSPVRKLPEVL